MDKLSVVNLPATANFPFIESESIFTLKTCQRSLVVGRSRLLNEMPCTCFEFYVGVEAYQFLLEVICGLKSHLLGENEIAAQFKTAYADYAKRSNKDTTLLQVLEKLFKDAKEVRSQFLTKLGQQSYASLSRTILSQRMTDGEVLILGSGSLAFSLGKLLKKKFQVTVAARNEEKQEEICSIFGFKKISWADQEKFKNYQAIINTVGTDDIIFQQDFFDEWLNNKRCFIDLASPSPIDTIHTKEQGLFRLEDIFRLSDERSEYKQQKIAHAKEFIAELAYRRRLLLQSSSLAHKESLHDLHIG